jgi:long-chain acyl-CoA synthetase
MILSKILEESAQNFPNKPALTMRVGYRTLTLSFKDVFEMAKRVAVFLDKNGIKKGDKVLIFAPNSPYWGCVFWGIILKGAVAVPLNVQSTAKMIEKIALQAENKIIFKSRYLKCDFSENLKVYDIEFLEELLQDFKSSDFKEVDIQEDDLIEILYTSGTTGDPKGVLLTHKNISTNILDIAKIIKLSCAKERLLSVLPLTHIYEQTIGFFLPCYYAAQVVYAYSYAAIPDLMQEYKITKMLAVPEFLKILMSKIKLAFIKKNKQRLFESLINFSFNIKCKSLSRILFYPVRKKLGGRLDTVASGGAFLDPELEKEWNALGITLLQGYGLTETSPVITMNSFDEHKFVSVGKALHKVELKLSEDGEIWVRGDSVFSGYFKNEQKTKECLTDDGWFKTGDMGYIDEDSFLFLKGRKKYLIKGAGAQNVFPEDVELELNKIDGVKDSCVVGFEKNGGVVEIHAVLLLDSKITNPWDVVDKANENLASYQQIGGYTIWPEEDFPRSATRKVKKEEVLKFLREKKKGQGIQSLEQENKSKLVRILSQITGITISHINNDTKIVKELSLDSLMRVELVVRIEEEFSVSIDESALVANITLAQLQEIIDKKEPAKKEKPLRKWPRSWWASCIRIVGQFFTFLFARIFIKLDVEGEENLKDLKFPVIFMPNHISYIDALPVCMALPVNIRKKLMFAAAKDVLYEEYKSVAWLSDLFFNTFPFPRQEGENIKFGLDYMGKLLDQGYSVVVFPEGKISQTGVLQSLKQGTGFMAVEMDSVVIPVKLVGTEKISPYGKLFPRKRGTVQVKFGVPLRFKKSDSYQFVTDKVEKSLREL